MKLGSTTLPLAGWLADPRQPELSRAQRLSAIRQLTTGYGLSAVELTLDLGMVYSGVFDRSFYTTVADLQQELGFACTVHLPFLWIDPASLNEVVRQASLKCLRRSVELTRPVTVDTYVMHLWGVTAGLIASQLQMESQRQAVLDALVAQAERSLAELCQVLDPRDLCVENLEDALFDLALPLLEQAGVSICLDVGHLAWGRGDAIEFLAQHGNRIREVHLHDAVSPSPDGSTQFRDHLPLGQGEIDYISFLSELETTGYDGAVILEVNDTAHLEQSLTQLRMVHIGNPGSRDSNL